MPAERLHIHALPKMNDATLILAFSGWMDGGNVSTGTVEWLVKSIGAEEVASIDPEDFYILNFPGSMEISALFRPHTEIEDGIITGFEPPENTFFADPAGRLALFWGKEPNVRWGAFAECVFDFAEQIGVSRLLFVGSVAGVVPHTREPRMMSVVSDPTLKPLLEPFGVNFTNYEGPASFSTLLLSEAPQRGFQMASLVAEIPAYIQGTNPRCIESVVRKLAGIVGLQVEMDDLRELSTHWEEKLTEALTEKPELVEHVEKLEADYDNDVFDTQMGDLKEWLEKQGIRVD